MTEQADAGGRARVLVVDDEPMNVDLLEQELELLGHDTVSARDGAEALDVLARTPVDLVLLDIMMPVLDGYAVLEQRRGDPRLRAIPFIVISATGDDASVIRCVEMGAEDYLPKPFDPVLLRARIGACLEKKRLHDREREHLAEIDRQRWRAEALLRAILPTAAVEELIGSGRVVPRRHEQVVVMFADVVGFTGFCEAHPPEEVVASLHRLALGFEELAARHGLEKKMVRDALVATAGLLAPSEDPVMASLRCAAAIVAAARLAGLGTDPGVRLSAAAWRRVPDHAPAVPLGPMPIKGKGEMEVWRLELPVSAAMWPCVRRHWPQWQLTTG
jgi:adenylate cyclase